MGNDNPMEVLEDRGELTQSQWSREGFKKFDDAMIKGTHGSTRVAVRFAQRTGYFGLSLRDRTFRSRDYKALLAHAEAHLKTLDELTFARYLKIRYERRPESHRGRHGSLHWSGGDADDLTIPAAGVCLEFDVYEVSEPFDTAVHDRGLRGSKRTRAWRRMTRGADGAWTAAGKDELAYDDALDHMIPWTEERQRTLENLKAGIADIDRMLRRIVGAGALEDGSGVLMLDKLDSGILRPPRLLGAGDPDEDEGDKPGKRRR